MKMKQIALSLAVAAYGMTASVTSAASDLNISQNPLFLLTPVKPAMIMGVDDSGSMDSEMVLPTNDGALWWEDNEDTFTGWETNDDNTVDVYDPSSSALNFNASGGNDNRWHKYTYLFPNGGLRRLGDDHHAVPPLPQYAYVRSPVFNPIYFDPTQEYLPYPSEGNEIFGDADPEDAKWDIIYSNEDVDLTQEIRRDENRWTFRLQDGMVVPAGTVVDDPDQGDMCDTGGVEDWNPLPADVTITNTFGGPAGDNDSCRLAIEYYAPTFWLPADMPAPDGFVGTALTGGKAPDGSPMLGYEIRSGNFSNYGEMIQNFANWFQYYRKRVFLTRSAIGQAFADTDFLRVGAFRINNRNAVDMIDMSSTSARRDFFDDQYDLRANGGTPNKQAVLHIGRQFERTGSNAPILEACQKNFGVLFTDGYSNNYTGAGVGNTDGEAGSDLFGTFLADGESNTMADIAYEFYANNLRPDLPAGKVPVPTACDTANPPLSLDCQEDLHMNFFAVMLGGIGLEFRRNEPATEDPWTNNPSWPTSFPNRNPSAIDDIWHAALNTRGEAFSADRPQDLILAFTELLQEVASSIQPVGVSATSTRLDQDSVFYEAELDSTTWSGDIRAIRAADSVIEWEASDRLPDPIDRNILVGTGDGGVDEFDTGLDADVRTRIFDATPIASDTAKQNLVINYLRGETSEEEQNEGVFRDRDGVIGDIANSRPQFSGPTNEGWVRLPSADGGGVGGAGSYGNYIDNVKATRAPLVLVGANAGKLHGFNADTGREEFAYIPAAVHSKLYELSRPDYSHKFFVDGQIAIGDARINGGWKTVAVAGLGAGGRGVFAIDITDPGGVGATDVLWELSADDHPELGHVFGQPVITRMADGTWVAIFGNGYNSDSGTPHLFIVDLASGNVLEKIEAGSSAGNGLSGVAAFLDPVSQLYVTRIYGGDLDGNMWRFDIGASSGDVGLGGNPLITVADNRPIGSPPTLAANPAGGLMVYFGSGKLIEPSDRISGSFEMEQFWAVRDRESSVSPGNLEVATMSVSDGNRVVNGASVSGDSDGWSLELGVGSPEGERVLSRPQVVFGSLVFTTFQPDDDPCAPGGQRRIYLLDALSGAGQLDQLCPNCGVIDVGLGAPIDPAIVLRPPTPPGGVDPGDDGGPFGPGGSGNLPGIDQVGSRDLWCPELLVLAQGEGFVSIGRLCDGRQIWRQDI